MSVVIHPDIVTESTTRKATVETAGSNTRGELTMLEFIATLLVVHLCK